MFDAITLDDFFVMLTVIGIDLALSADNAVVIGLAAATLPKERRRKVVAVGTIVALWLRIVLAVSAVKLLGIVGLVLAGGVLLLYVTWKLWWDLKGHAQADHQIETHQNPVWDARAFRRALIRIVLADLSMSIENILAVAGAARNHITIMMIGLGFSVILTGIAAGIIARLLDRHRWIGYVGVVLILWVSLRMIWDGGIDVMTKLGLG